LKNLFLNHDGSLAPAGSTCMKLFGTDGIRDIVGGEKMNPEIAASFGEAVVSFCRKRNLPTRIVIGRDTRESGPMLEEAVVSGDRSVGFIFALLVLPRKVFGLGLEGS